MTQARTTEPNIRTKTIAPNQTQKSNASGGGKVEPETKIKGTADGK